MCVVQDAESWSFDIIREKLSIRDTDSVLPSGNRTRAAVAMILDRNGNELSVLFIQRAAHELDPWSGHIAFPGGKLEPGETECQAACRETREETGINLEQECYLGRLSDIVGTNLPVWVSCCLFAVDRSKIITEMNEEVCDLFWIPVTELQNCSRHIISPVAFGDKKLDVPAIRLPIDNKPVLWGITYRLVMQFLDVMKGEPGPYQDSFRLPAMVEIDEEVDK